jgi:hypothetical protein
MPMKIEECSETVAYKIQTPGNYPEKSVQHSEHGESLKWRNNMKIIKEKCIKIATHNIGYGVDTFSTFDAY